MASVAIDPQPSVVTRVANLPLVSSTYDLVSSAYVSTKDHYPYLRSLCEMAEKGVKTMTSVAVTSALPIIQKLEPQIAVANTYACKGLDKIEERLPILNQPTTEIVANAKGAVTGAKDAVTMTVVGAKDSVASTITGVVDKTKGAVTGSVERTKSVVNDSINTVLGSRMVQLVSSGVENALAKSELLVDQYLPLTQEELETEAKKVEGFDMVQKPSYYVRLGSLSTKLRSRAYQQALSRVKDAKQKSQETISQGLPRLVCAFLFAACCCCRRAMGVPGEEKQPAPTPDLVEVEVGSTALLKCGSSHSSVNFSHVDWFLIHKEKQIPIFRVRQGQGQNEPGEYEHRLRLQEGLGGTLVLSQVTPHDERVFLCKSKRPRLQDHFIELRVYKAPEEPTIQANVVGIHVDRQELREVATCVGRNGYPIPQVIWYKNGRPLQEEENRVQIQSSQIVESSGLYTLQSILNARLVKEDKDAQFYCELSYRLPSGNRMKESREVTVPVFYPAEKVWVEVEPLGLLKEGDHVKIRCQTDGNPQPHFIINKQNSNTGEMEEEEATDEDENGILFLEPAQKQHSGLYQCQTLDLETMTTLSSDPQELIVNYVSAVQVNPAAPEAQEGDSLTLTCEAESNKGLEFQWLRDKTGQLLGKGPVLQLNNLKREAGGRYLCMASVPNVPGLNRTQLVNVGIFGSPWMARKERKVWVQENAVLNLSCEASGHPQPTISWNVNGSVTEWNPEPQTVVSTLNVLVTPKLLETGAECTATNSLGSNTTIIILKLVTLTTLTPDFSQTTGLSTSTVSPHIRANSTSTEKKLPQPESKGVVIVAVIVCILVLAVLGATLYFFYKKGKLPCGRSGKQEITMPPTRKSDFVVEVKSDKLPEEMALLQGSNGDKRAPGDQGEKYIDLRN